MLLGMTDVRRRMEQKDTVTCAANSSAGEEPLGLSKVAQRRSKMAWERRQRGSGRRYYYRSRRVRGRVVKEYVGTGADGERAAAADAQARAERHADRDRVRRAASKLAPAEAATREMDEAMILLSHAALYAAGFHQVNYQWRLRRAG